ncbi:MAG: hypothetical protein AYK18_00860 [Theionarchaea archaeon DG-70]|nr:MAG: hypothetical protein AYK18_00860 [Theionarchaea archaeon DG-70]
MIIRDSRSTMKNAVLVCHCILDPLTRAEGTKKITRDIIKEVLQNDISIIQLPCPEMIYGFHRAPCNKEDYDTPEYRRHCRTLAEHTANTVAAYNDAHFTIFGLISVGGSPSCGCQRTHVQGEHVNEPGVFIEELQHVFSEKGIDITITDHELLETEREKEAFLSLRKRG